MSIFPLPDIVEISQFGGNWDNYCKHLYKIFSDKIFNKLTFMGLPISCRKYEEISSYPRSFWHLITDAKSKHIKDEDRTVNLRRCERLEWVPHIINHSMSEHVICWETKQRNENNIHLWLKSEKYMIVLARRETYFLLKTAFIEYPNRQKNYLRSAQNNPDPRKN